MVVEKRFMASRNEGERNAAPIDSIITYEHCAGRVDRNEGFDLEVIAR